jgi:hypothetical protein
MNVGLEFLEHARNVKVDGTEILCCLHVVILGKKESFLTTGFTKEDLSEFLSQINYTYLKTNNQIVSGTIWFSDNSWSQRVFIFGDERWENFKRPEIPSTLIRIDKERDVKLDKLLNSPVSS